MSGFGESRWAADMGAVNAVGGVYEAAILGNGKGTAGKAEALANSVTGCIWCSASGLAGSCRAGYRITGLAVGVGRDIRTTKQLWEPLLSR